MIEQIEERRAYLAEAQDNPIHKAIGTWLYLKDIDCLLKDRARLCRKCNDLQSDIIAERVIVHRLDRERWDHRTDPNL